MKLRRDPRNGGRGVESLEARYCLSSIGFVPQGIYGHLIGGEQAMTTGDLDGDGDLDFIGGSISWRANDGNGQFGENRFISAEVSEADRLVAGDVDGDGDMDIVSSSSTDAELSWYENRDGQGKFGPKQTIASFSGRTRALAAADLDSDGDLDIMHSTAEFPSDDFAIVWYQNVEGNGFFVRRTLANELTWDLAIVDLDHDSDLDVVAGTAWFENVDGQRNFVRRPALGCAGSDQFFISSYMWSD